MATVIGIETAHDRAARNVSIEPEDHELVCWARNYAPRLRERQAEINELGRIPKDIEQELVDAGIYRLMVPKEYGGYQGRLIDWAKMITELARGDAGAAWAVTLVTSCIWTLNTYFPKHVVDEVYSDPNARLAGVFGNRGVKARKVEGGVIIEKGVWPFNSGVYQAQWDIFGVDYEENGESRQTLMLLPISDVTLLDDWDVSGIRGSGSTTATVENVFVPDERIVDKRKIISGVADNKNFADSYSNIAFQPLMVSVICYPLIGAALHMLEHTREKMPGRNIILSTYADSSQAPMTHFQYADAASKIEAGQLLHFDVAKRIDKWAASGEYMPREIRAKCNRDDTFANRLLWEGMDELANLAGGSFARNDNIVNRMWQDAKVATMHAAVNYAVVHENYGRLTFGLPPIMPV